MSTVTVTPLGPGTISQSENDNVVYVGSGTLNIAGTAQSPITVTLSSVAGLSAASTTNITYADVTLAGTAGVSALATYNIGAGGTLRLQSTAGVSVGPTINFTGLRSHLVLANGVDLRLLGAINGFGPGSNIDVAFGSVSYTYDDNAGTGTGGTITLSDGNGNTKTIALSTGEFTRSSFNVHSDGNGGTLIDFATVVSTITATPSTADLNVGANVVLQLGTTGPVTITGGTPTLTLSDGGVATYDASSSTSTSLVFRHTVQPGQNTADLTVTGTNLNGATVTDAIGNSVNLAGGATNPAGILQIDTTPPTIASVTTTPGSGDLGAGQIVSINLTPSEAVTVAGGTPTLTLNDGGTAAYDASSSTSTLLVFKYIVQSGQNTADLTITGTSLNGAVITDGAGNPINLAGAITNPAGILQIDTTPPAIASVTTTPGSGDLGVGQVVAINVSTTEAVTVAGGTPTLTLNDGGTATYDAASSTPTQLVFRYTVQPGQNTADLTITGSNLNGASITDGAGNLMLLSGAVTNPAGILQIDTTAPTVTAVATTPSSGVIAAGQVVTINVTPSENVTVTGGVPTLTLSDGGTATYDAANSTPTNLVFRHTVQPGQTSGDLTITGSNLNGATIADGAGNALNLSGVVANPPGTLQIDGTAPTVSSLTTTPGSGDLTTGQMVTFNLTPSKAVTVAGGTPTLALNDGGTATYDPASSTATQLVFRYTVQPGQNTADLTVTGTNLNGASITDGAGNAMNLSGAVTNPAGILQIDTTAPTVIAVATTPSSGVIAAGQVVTINVTPSENVTVTGGVPTLTLSDGGTATYDAANSTPTNLVFRHTVQSGQNTADLTITGSNLNGAAIADGAGNAINLSGVIGNPPGTLRIDGTIPTVTSLTTTPGSGDLTTGQTVALTVTSSKAVTVAGGTPTLILNDGGTATYDPASSTSTSLVFRYTVQAGQNTADLAVTGTNLNGATITDSSGNAADLSGAVTNPAGILQIDTTAPTVASVATVPGSGTLSAGQVVTINVTPSEAITVGGGTPTLTLSDGGTATYDASTSTPTMMVFKHIVQAGQNTADLTITAANLNGATITDGAGNALNLSGAVGNPPGVLQIDTSGAAVTSVYSVTTTPGSGDLTTGGTVALSVTLTGNATVTGGPPTLTLSDGGTATYDAASSTATNLVFRHTVQAGQNTADLAVTNLLLNGATITDASGNAVDLSGAVTNPAGILQVDTTPPAITTVSTTPSSGDLAAGQIVAFNVATSEAVTVTVGTPTLTLNDGGTATYDAVNSTPTLLVFKYTVQTGQNTADLTVTGTNLNGATIADGAGNALPLSGAIGNPAGILQIDTTAPTITAVTTNPSNGAISAGQVVTINVTPSENVTVTGGVPTLTLSDGGVATYDAASSTATNLVFRHTVQAGQNTADLTITGSNLNGATIADGAGNALNLSGAVGNPPGTLQIDGTAPTVTSLTTTPGSGDLTTGQMVRFNLTPSEAVTITGGTPTLTLNDGGTATYDPASSTSASLVFRYTVAAGENTADLAVTGTNLNGASIVDTAGNVMDLSGAITNPAGILQIDTTAPVITTVSTTPGSGAFAAGRVITINLTPSEAVTVAGGVPTLTLNDGGTATYDAANSTSIQLVFRHTIQPGQNAADLTITAVNLNGSTIADGAGNALNLSGAVTNPAGILRVDTTPPVITNVTTTPGTGSITNGQMVTITVTPSEEVVVGGGIPTLTLSDGGIATYDPANSTPTAMVFTHIVQAGQNTADLTITGANLNGAMVTDASGNALDLSGAIGNPPGILQVDTTPMVTSIVATPSTADLRAGANVVFNVAMSAPTSITGGTPTLTLNDGGSAAYDAASSTPTLLVFRYTVQAGQNTPDLAVTAVNLNSAAVTDGAGNVASLAGAVANPAGTLQIDTTPPMAIDIEETRTVQTPGYFQILINISEPVIVSGGPAMFLLSNGGTATYNPLLSTPTATVFRYTIPAGQDPSSIVVTGFNPNGSTLTDLAGNPIDAPSIGAALAAAQGNVVDINSTISPKTIDVYRFFDNKTGTHFYTQNQSERQNILNTRPDLVPEGPNGVGLEAIDPSSNDPKAVPVYRFFDTKQGTQFLTASATERDTIIATRSDLVYEPSSIFYEHAQAQTGDTAVYRFFDTRYGTHFYTDDPNERASILQNRPDLVQEGVGFYEPARNPST